MANPNDPDSRHRPSKEDRASWNPYDAQDRLERDRDRDRDCDCDDDRWASDRNRSSYLDRDTGNRDRDAMDAMLEGYDQVQSGYNAGRYAEDRSQSYRSRNQSYSFGGHDDRQSGRSGIGRDDRFTGRGGGAWVERSNYDPDRSGGYGPDRGRETGYRGSRTGTGGMVGGSNDAGRFESGRRSSFGYDRDYGSDYGGSSIARYDQRRDMTGDRGMDDERGTGGHRGKGPQNWQRSDERIRESVNEALADHDQIDATHLQVTVKDGEVTLSGTVEDRRMKRLAEGCVEQVSGVKEVQNHIRIQSNDS